MSEVRERCPKLGNTTLFRRRMKRHNPVIKLDCFMMTLGEFWPNDVVKPPVHFNVFSSGFKGQGGGAF